MEQKITTFGAGQTIFRQGEKGGELYFIKSGKVELTVHNEETGNEAVVAVMGERAVLGTMSFLENDARSATAKAATEVQCIVIPQVQREKLLSSIPNWFRVLVKDMSSNIRRLNEEFTNLKTKYDKLEKRFNNLKARTDEAEQKAQQDC